MRPPSTPAARPMTLMRWSSVSNGSKYSSCGAKIRGFASRQSYSRDEPERSVDSTNSAGRATALEHGCDVKSSFCTLNGGSSGISSSDCARLATGFLDSLETSAVTISMISPTLGFESIVAASSSTPVAFAIEFLSSMIDNESRPSESSFASSTTRSESAASRKIFNTVADAAVTSNSCVTSIGWGSTESALSFAGNLDCGSTKCCAPWRIAMTAHYLF